MALEVTLEKFQSDVLEKSLTVPVLVDFWAEWCGPCKMLGPVLEKLEKDYGGSFLLVKVNTDLEQELAAHFRITGIPAVKLIAGGRLKDEFTGALPEAQVKAFLKKNKIEPVATTPAEAPSGADLISQADSILKKETISEGDHSVLWAAALQSFAEQKQFEPYLAKIPELGSAYSDRRSALSRFVEGGDPEKLKYGRIALTDPASAMEYFLNRLQSASGDARNRAKDDLVFCFHVAGNASDITNAYRRKLAAIWF
jgi:putative thioredoxin